MTAALRCKERHLRSSVLYLENSLTAWAPIFSPTSKTATYARDAVVAIAKAIIEKDYDVGAKRRMAACEEGLLYGYLAVAHDDRAWAIRATESLNHAIDETNSAFDYPGLFGGLTGLGWTVEHICPLLAKLSVRDDAADSEGIPIEDESEDEDEDLNADIDVAVLRKVDNTNYSTDYDLISGLVGFGTYFLERLPRERAVDGVKAVFEQLNKLAIRGNEGITWHTSPDLLPDWQRELSPNGYYNLGVAHGIPGVIHFLSEVAATNIVGWDRSQLLLEGAVDWLIAQQRPRNSLSRFSSWVVPGRESTDTRLGWCYGDLGILAVLLQVTRRVGRSDWRLFTQELLDHCLAWPSEQSGIGDAILCHGAAGVAHIFNRIYQAEGDCRCLNAALLWYERALEMRRPGTGVGGFLTLTRPNPSGSIVWEASPSFLDGAIGVALAFLAALTPVEPGWDRMLLLSGRR